VAGWLTSSTLLCREISLSGFMDWRVEGDGGQAEKFLPNRVTTDDGCFCRGMKAAVTATQCRKRSKQFHAEPWCWLAPGYTYDFPWYHLLLEPRRLSMDGAVEVSWRGGAGHAAEAHPRAQTGSSSPSADSPALQGSLAASPIPITPFRIKLSTM
jgi:hypothetical protein